MNLLPRGYRNNNPGNIRKSHEAWQGLSPTQTDPEFFQFIDLPHGIRAMAVILRNYQKLYNLRTPMQIISRWAPPSENDTEAYAKSVAAIAGASVDLPVFLSGSVLLKFIRGIIRQENGMATSLLISDATIQKGIDLV